MQAHMRKHAHACMRACDNITPHQYALQDTHLLHRLTIATHQEKTEESLFQA
jgi:hypothetical protein